MAERKVSKTVGEGSVQFEFATGETVTVKAADFKDEIQDQLVLHGLSQKLGDSYSGEDAEKCHAIFQGVLKNLTDGNWSARSGGGGGSRISQLAEALSRETGKKVEDCVVKLASLSDEKKQAVQDHPNIKSHLAQIKLEKAQAAATKLKAELGDKVEPLKL